MRRKRFEDPLAKAFGQRLRALRKERGWTQADLAQRLDVHQTITGYYERGEHYPPLPMLKKLAAALEVSIDTLVGSNSRAPDRFQDAELLEFFLRADKLDHKTRSSLKDVLEGVLVKAEIERRGRHDGVGSHSSENR